MSDLHRPENIPSYLIWGGWYGSRNIGDTAILLGLRDLITELHCGSDVYIRALSTDVDYTCQNGVTGERAMIKSDVFRLWPWFNIIRVFRRSDRIVISGGTPIFDSSHGIRTFYLLLGYLLRKPFVVFGAGVKPIESWYGRRYIPFFLRKASLITTRDADSQRILKELGLRDVELTADSAFFAPAADPTSVADLLASLDIQQKDKLLVVAPRLLSVERERLYLQEQMDKEVIQNTPEKIAQVVDNVATRFDRVLFVAMHFYGPDSDVPIINEIMRLCKSSNISLLDREVRPEAAIGIFRRADVLLGVRLHALLLAASMETPIVGIAYEQKVRSLFERLELEEFCCDLFGFTTEELSAAVIKAVDEKEALSAHLATRVKHLRDLVRAAASRAFGADV